MCSWVLAVCVTLSTLSRLLNRSVSWPNTVVKELRRPLSSRTNRVSTASSISRRSAQTDRQTRKTGKQTHKMHIRVCLCLCVCLPGSLAKMDSASSQTMSSLLLAPCRADERGFTSSIVLMRVIVSWRCGGKHITHARTQQRHTL